MNLNQLEYFIDACEEGSISNAAKRAHVSQQSVSAAVAALERELHTPLLVRSHGGVTVTAEGEIAYRHGLDALAAVAALRSELAQRRSDMAGSLTFAYIPEVFFSCGYTFGDDTLASFRAQWPNISLQAMKGQTDFCESLVKQGIADLALVTGSVSADKFRVIPVWEGEAVLYVSKKHPLASRAAVTFDDLRGQKMLSVPNGGYPAFVIVEHCKKHGFVPDLIANSNTSLYEPKPDEVSIVLEGFAWQGVPDGFVTVPFVAEDSFKIPAQVIVPAGTQPGPEAEALIGHLRSEFGRVQDAIDARRAHPADA